MQKSKRYPRAKFRQEVITAALSRLTATLSSNVAANLVFRVVGFGNEQWDHTSDAEFFEDYRRDDCYAIYRVTFDGSASQKASFMLELDDDRTRITVATAERSVIQDVFAAFEAAVAQSVRPAKPLPQPRVFVGHGRSAAWRDLKDHLHEKHGFDVEAYEIGARAGHTIRDILTDMLVRSSFAVLVMTPEDETTSGELNPRLNVVHEAGLFQGRLGFERAIVLLEEGTTEFSNIAGIQQIRFSKNNIRETFGEVLATLRREFPR
jgi:predicted nucleotide-binding protein